ncbi:MAG TPA: DUF4229 domain-containing protein [Micromonosporaceae bacterium]|nr:DUF4229 domain-containing protein [Micromonosporaceae bacterium]
MNPVVKYTLARFGLFILVAAVLIAVPVPIHLLIKLALAIVISAALSLFLLRGLRDQVMAHWAGVAAERAARKERLRAALAGDDEPSQDGDERTPHQGSAGSSGGARKRPGVAAAPEAAGSSSGGEVVESKTREPLEKPR